MKFTIPAKRISPFDVLDMILSDDFKIIKTERNKRLTNDNALCDAIRICLGKDSLYAICRNNELNDDSNTVTDRKILKSIIDTNAANDVY